MVALERYITTVETSKHRFFTFLDKRILPDNMLVNIASEDSFILGILSSRIHVIWALRAGGRLGVGNDPRYNKTKCFETFPFPAANEADMKTIRELAEQIDAHRKRQQATHPKLTLTNCYNVLEKLRGEQPLTAKEKQTHEQGLVAVLRELHDELDCAVFTAYGWSDLADELVGLPGATTPLPDKPDAQAATEETLLCRLLELNIERSHEEAQGQVRWLRPEFQHPTGTQADIGLVQKADQPKAAIGAKKPAWPKALPEQIGAIQMALQTTPSSAEQLARRFSRAPTKRVAELLDTLVTLGQARQTNNGRYISTRD